MFFILYFGVYIHTAIPYTLFIRFCMTLLKFTYEKYQVYITLFYLIMAH